MKNKKRKKTYFVVREDHRLKIKKNEKRDKYLDFVRELKKLLNMGVTVIPIVYRVLGRVHKGLEKGIKELEIGGRIETIQTTVLMRSEKFHQLMLL